MMLPPKPVAPLKVTKSPLSAPCEESATVITELFNVAVNGSVSVTVSRIGVMS